MWQDLSTKVHSVRELMAWLGERRDADPPPPEPDRAWEPNVTSVMQAPQLEAILAEEQLAQPASPGGVSVSGSLAAFHIVELLQALVGDERAGVLSLRDGECRLRVYLQGGRVVAALQEHEEKVAPREVLRHAATMRTGDFEFAPLQAMEYPSQSAVDTSMVQLLIELSAVAWGSDDEDSALHALPSSEPGPFGGQTEEFLLADTPVPAVVSPRGNHDPSASHEERTLIVRVASPSSPRPAPVELPPLPSLRGGQLRLARPLTARLRDLSSWELDVLQAALNHGSVARCESMLEGDPTQTRTVIGGLLARGYLVED
ncbi:MAG: DUF4388 domain-containing protein [Myxococcota bacterium]